jgi:Putative death-receptor fusion protein (DUF2428)
MTGILLPSSLEEFNGVIRSLASLARSERNISATTTDDQQAGLPEVHALNCLREIFSNSRFKERTASWLVKVLDLAASSLSSSIWAIRNCGLMLFQTCVSRVGAVADTSDVESCGSVSPSLSEDMVTIAFSLLNSGQQLGSDSPELVFAGLDLMSRMNIPSTSQDQARGQMIVQLRSPIWMIREHAARLYASQTSEKDALGAATHLVSSMAWSNQNECHGILLCTRMLLGKYVDALLPLSSPELFILEEALEHHSCELQQCGAPAVQSAFFDILNDYITLRYQSAAQSLTGCAKRLHRTQEPHSSCQIDAQTVSKKPFGSQLQSSMALNLCLTILTGASATAQTLYHIFQDLAARDFDAAAFLLQAIRDQDISDKAALQLQLDFYISLVPDSCDEGIRAAAMFGLSSCLSHSDESKELFISKPDLDRLISSFVDSPFTECRELFNAKVRGLGSLFAYISRGMQSIWKQHADKPLNLWTTMLRNAAKDNTEASTRLNAVESVDCFRQCFLLECDEAGQKRKLSLYLVLYDLLNDDDEEIRVLAASTASFVLKSAAGANLPLCPLAASYRLSGYLVEAFPGVADFHSMALSRIMFPPSAEVYFPHNFDVLVSRCSVSKQLDAARHESHDLFEEERQNLYWDDVREIDIWYMALTKVSSAWLDVDFRELAGHWTLEGLRELKTALPSLTSGPFGDLSKLEIIILFMRVIRLAELMLQWRNSSDCDPGLPSKSTYLIEMERLLSAAQEHPLHPQVQKVLEDGVRRSQLGRRIDTGWVDSIRAEKE